MKEPVDYESDVTPSVQLHSPVPNPAAQASHKDDVSDSAPTKIIIECLPVQPATEVHSPERKTNNDDNIEDDNNVALNDEEGSGLKAAQNAPKDDNGEEAEIDNELL